MRNTERNGTEYGTKYGLEYGMTVLCIGYVIFDLYALLGNKWKWQTSDSLNSRSVEDLKMICMKQPGN